MSQEPINIASADASGAGDGVETTDSAAAQGGRGRHALTILLVSFVLVVVVLFGLYFANHHALSTNKGAGGQSGINNPAAAAQFHQAPPSPKQAPPGMPSTEPSGGGESRAANSAG